LPTFSFRRPPLPFGVDPTKELLTLPCQFTLPFALQPTPVTRVNFYAPGRTPVKVLSRPFPSVLVFLSHVQPCVVSNQGLIFLIGSKVYTERFLSAPYSGGIIQRSCHFRYPVKAPTYLYVPCGGLQVVECIPTPIRAASSGTVVAQVSTLHRVHN
jgi:hypothetical protein